MIGISSWQDENSNIKNATKGRFFKKWVVESHKKLVVILRFSPQLAFTKKPIGCCKYETLFLNILSCYPII